ncbi:hypothetical protein PILCRDRAFT_11324 [Piloderma croceum F 1598]|uniref:Uncharacterized protein n=1 Tax=Piloderma croceum (strain F 1598) TaxID=765440 RepID=A0A0C3BM01_PILCF|nr:hypothetical protein PILCRDRAFT_11324 [Piloderma croceum F 1598]
MDLDSISTDTFQTVMGRGQRSKDPERISDDDERPRPKRKSSRKCKPTIIDSGNSFDPLEVEISSDADDDDFVAEESGTESSKAETDGSDIQELTNAEVYLDFSARS